ncbi:MAG: signal peptidase II [Alphaproteobacteria bacterium]|nr:signal peptidase II [Alphaproteobacteria bacterium]
MTRLARLGLGLAALILVADQLTKAWMMGLLQGAGRAVEVTGFFKLVTVWNRGMSFGLFNDAQASWALIALALAISGILLWWLKGTTRALPGLAIGLVLGGALGNVVDRLRFGAVFDFLYFHIGEWYWPAFNLADSAITVGVALLLLDGLSESRESPKNSAKAR